MKPEINSSKLLDKASEETKNIINEYAKLYEIEPGQTLLRLSVIETHMFLGSFKKKISIDGYIKNNCTEPEAVASRHDALVAEMLRRGYNHKSPMSEEEAQESLEYLGDKRYVKVDKKASLEDLLKRCTIPLVMSNSHKHALKTH